MRYKGIKAKAWEAVRAYVKAKEKDCYTCGKKDLHSYDAQAGHCWPVGHVGSNNTLSWDERQIHLQCGRCNGAGQGEQSKYIARLTQDYGEEVVKELEARRWKTDAIKNWESVIGRYKELLNQVI